jgi:hypothetical protein
MREARYAGTKARFWTKTKDSAVVLSEIDDCARMALSSHVWKSALDQPVNGADTGTQAVELPIR